MPSRSRQKGDREERSLVNFWRAHKVKAARVPLSGSGDIKGDVLLSGLVVECKHYRSGFKMIYDWLKKDGADLLTIKVDRKERLYVIPERTMVRLYQRKKML